MGKYTYMLHKQGRKINLEHNKFGTRNLLLPSPFKKNLKILNENVKKRVQGPFKGQRAMLSSRAKYVWPEQNVL
jgi:hypothetical protein